MTGNMMVRFNLLVRRIFRFAHAHTIRTSGVKIAAGGRVNRGRHIPQQHNLFGPLARTNTGGREHPQGLAAIHFYRFFVHSVWKMDSMI
jgi:hypothetical protein